MRNPTDASRNHPSRPTSLLPARSRALSVVLAVLLVAGAFGVSAARDYVTTAQAAANAAPAATWHITWQDEFDQGYLDGSKWVTCYPWYNPQTGCTNTGNNELQWYLPDGVSVSNGTLKLTARRRTVTGTNGQTYYYTSGMISSGPSMGSAARYQYQYGTLTARVRLPRGKGFWPAVWTLPTDTSWPPEVDGLEAAGSQPNTISMNVHWNSGSGNQQSQTIFTGPDFTAGWHLISVKWEPGALHWYVDGIERKGLVNSSAVPNKPMYILLNLAIDGTNPPDGSTPFPSTMEVDNVRVWNYW